MTVAAGQIDSIAAGDTRQTSTVLWADTSSATQVTFQVSTTANFSTIARTVSVNVAGDLTPGKVLVEGLTPGTAYYYRATTTQGDIESGRFVTAQAVGAASTGVTFGVSGDWRGELAPFSAVSNADTRGLDFFVALGDTIYADYPSPALPQPQAETLTDYMTKHAEVYGTRGGQNFFADLRKTTSFFATVDDHEVINDFSGGAPISTDPRFGAASSTLINDSALFDNGMTAFQAWNPIEDVFYGATGDARTAGERDLYRSVSYGADAATFILDTRSFRDAGLPGVTNPADPQQVGAYLGASFNPTRTLLGDAQLDQLKADLLEAEQNGVTWKFIMVPEPIQNLGIVGASDRFEGYAAERTEILRYITENDIDNVVFVAADIHGTLVNNLTYQNTPGGPQIATNAFEITTGSVAFDAPFGPTVVDLAAGLGLLSPQQLAFYNSLPTAGKDAFVEGLVNQQIQPLGYDPVGLDNNLAIAAGKINAQLLVGDYTATHVFGWTEFDVAPGAQTLTVTTFGIDAYTVAQAAANPAAHAGRTPSIVQQFQVTAQTDAAITRTGTRANDVFTGDRGNDTLTGDRGNDRLTGYAGADSLNGGIGNDTLTGGVGNDTMAGGKGGDTFVFAPGGGVDRVLDFSWPVDRLDLSAFDVTLAQVRLTAVTGGYLVEVADVDIFLAGARLQGVDASVFLIL